jgi:HEPN domain-containing protein
MQPDPIRCAETAAWIRKSRKDLWRADAALTLDPPDTEDCLFHCQQAVEKSLKAFLVWRDQPFRKPHDIVELGRQCADLEPALANALQSLGPLTRFAWEFRYPGDTEPPTIAASQVWGSRTRVAITAIAGLLPPEARSEDALLPF